MFNRKEYNKQYYQNNKDLIKAYMKQYYQNNKDLIKEKHKEYRKKNGKTINEYAKEYRKKNGKTINEYAKEYRKKNGKTIKEKRKEYHKKNGKTFAHNEIMYNTNCILCGKEIIDIYYNQFKKYCSSKCMHKYWYCNYTTEEYYKNWREKNREKIKIARKKNYIKNRKNILKRHKIYREKPENKERNAIKNRRRAKIYKAKYSRNKKWIKIFDNIFPNDVNVHFHHINDYFVIPIPSNMHIKTTGIKVEKHREKCNQVIKDIYGLNIEELLKP